MYKKYLFLLSIVSINVSCMNLPNKKEAKVITTYARQVSNIENNKTSKNVEIVFCLDATGSMSGLIGTAKEKIWNIVSELAQNNEIESLKLGMVFYRDKGDAFITRKIHLTTDLDEVYDQLLEIEAAGGGDTPESVNQALYESITEIQWSKDKNAYRTIFVVGDCPPHMDYQDDVKYTKSCKLAASKRITINTIKLGNSCKEAIYHFKKMAECTNGEFLQLDQHAQDIVITTPYDDEIYEISKAIDESRIYYGNEQEQTFNYNKKAKSLIVYEKSSKTSNTARAKYKLSKAGKKSLGTKELVNDYIDDKIKLEEIEKDELPKELQGKSKKEIKVKLENLIKERKKNENKLKKLSEKRKGYIKEKKKSLTTKQKASFSEKVVKILKEQSKKKEKELVD